MSRELPNYKQPYTEEDSNRPPSSRGRKGQDSLKSAILFLLLAGGGVELGKSFETRNPANAPTQAISVDTVWSEEYQLWHKSLFGAIPATEPAGTAIAQGLEEVYFPLVIQSERRGHGIFYADTTNTVGGNYGIYYDGRETVPLADDINGRPVIDWEPFGVSTPDGLAFGWSISTPGEGSQVWLRDPEGDYFPLTEGLGRYCYEADIGFPDGTTSIFDIVNGAVVEYKFAQFVSSAQEGTLPKSRVVFGDPEQKTEVTLKNEEVDISPQTGNPKFLTVAFPEDPSLSRYMSAVVIIDGGIHYLIIDRLTGHYYEPRLEEGLTPYNAVHAWGYFVGTKGGKKEIWSYDFYSDIVGKAVSGRNLMDPDRIVSLPPNRGLEDAVVVTVVADDWDEGTLALIYLSGDGEARLSQQVLSLSPGYRRSPRFAPSTETIIETQERGKLRSIGQTVQWSEQPLPGYKPMLPTQ